MGGFAVPGLVLAAAALTAAVAAPVPAASAMPRTGAIESTPDPQDLDLARLVPAAGRIDHVWYVPRGQTVPQVVVAWHFRDPRPVPGWSDTRRFVVTLWNPERITAGSARWVPHTLIRASPFELSGRSIRLADVTADGHDDLLVTVYCSDCNHGAAVASIFATFGRNVRRIYGRGVLGVAKGPGNDAVVHGRPISETWWGARDGQVWFDQGSDWSGGRGVCCPKFRLQTFLRWTGHGWRTVGQRRVRPEKDQLLRHPMP